MSQPPLIRCPRCQRHVTADSPACPFCAAPIAALGRGFGAPDPSAPLPADEPPRAEATLYGLPPVREADLPVRLSDQHYPMPAYGMSPTVVRRRVGLLVVSALLVLSAVVVGVWLVLGR